MTFDEAVEFVRANFDILVVSYSGGKDSSCVLVWCQENFPEKKIVGVTADTGNEMPGTREHVEEISRITGVPITWCDDPIVYKDGSELKDIFDVTRRRGMFPIPGVCEWRGVLKRERLRKWIRAQDFPRPIWVMGQRREESRSRAQMPYFAGGDNKWRYGAEIFRPILDWEEGEVYRYLAEHEVPLHPAYGQGFTRLSCLGCLMAPLGAMKLYLKVYPDEMRRLLQFEEEMGQPWKSGYSLQSLVARLAAEEAEGVGDDEEEVGWVCMHYDMFCG